MEIHRRLNELISQWENEVVEFKQADKNYDTDLIGRYFSALANEANLRNLDSAWLIFGVGDKTRQIVGTNYRPEPARLNGLKQQITADCDPPVSLRDIHVLDSNGKRVILFEIPAAPQGIPIAWKGHYYARAGESLTAMGLDKLDKIRGQGIKNDWSAQIIQDASFSDLDENALQTARKSFALKYANRISESEVMGWSLETFLNRAKITINGRITRAALLLLGKAESTHFLSPHPGQMTWKLETAERAYEHFSPPFLLNTTNLFRRIRNVQVRIQPDNSLLPVEEAKYDQKVILEALHNCIAHQDYTKNGRIVVTEYQDKLVFENEGMFFDKSPEDYFLGQQTPLRYRNQFLVTAMVELNMIDQMGYGIYEIFQSQARRYFPLPDYSTREQNVSLTIHGKILNDGYSKILMMKTDLPLKDILLLDLVQKNLPIPESGLKYLRRAGLIEGRKGMLRFSAQIAKAIDRVEDYILTRGQDNEFYKKQIVDFIGTQGSATRKQIDRLLLKKFSEALSSMQKDKKVRYLLTDLRRNDIISNIGTRKEPIWVIATKKST